MPENIKTFLAALIGVTLFLSAADTAQTEDFFKGKTIRFIVGNSPGGTFDAYTRAILPNTSPVIPRSS
jgi:tripartite-type tricarboxylate transporter receptor subunit TctC